MYNDDVSWLDWLALALVLIGALNWGLIGIDGLMDDTAVTSTESDLNLVDIIAGDSPLVEALIYLIVGLAGLYTLIRALQAYSRYSDRDRADTTHTTADTTRVDTTGDDEW